MGQWAKLAKMTQRASAGVFGEPATLTVDGDEYEVDGEYDAPSTREIAEGGEVFVSAEPARITLRTEQFTGPITPRTDTVEVRGTTYKITEVRPDGAGSVVLLLRE